MLPLFLAFIFGIIVFGSYLAMVHGVQQLAAEAARSSIAGMTDTERNSLATNYVTANVSTYPLLVASNLTVNAAPSPSNASPTSAPLARTRAWRSTRFSGWIGSAGWFGNVPSSSP